MQIAGLTARADQLALADAVDKAIEDGYTRICVEGKTGLGKSLVQMLIVWRMLDRGKTVAQMTPRLTLTNAMIGWAERAEIPFGVRHADYPDYDNPGAGLQICSSMTEVSRTKSIKHDTLEADVILVDETHMNLSKDGRTYNLLCNCVKDGSVVIGFTATPTEIDHFYETLILGPTYKELWDMGVLVRGRLYDGGFPAIDAIKGIRNSDGEYNKTKLKKARYTQQIFASVFEQFYTQNPDCRPWFVFANGVEESRWFCDEFNKRGITAAHVDGEFVYEGGKEFKDKSRRFELIEEMGDVSTKLRVLCARFVLREGVDAPSVFGGSLATPVGSLRSYIQMCGRFARAHETKQFYKLLDHGGNVRRHGSPNEERDWRGNWELKATEIEAIRAAHVNSGKRAQPFSCKSCGLMWDKVPKSARCECGNDLRTTFACCHCGHKHFRFPSDCCCEQCGKSIRSIRTRPVIQSDGTLRHVSDDALKQQKVSVVAGTQELWMRSFWSAFKSKEPGETKLRSKWGWFVKQHTERYYCHPPETMAYMPVDPKGWYTPVSKLRWCDLRKDEHGNAFESTGLVLESIKKRKKQRAR